MGSIQISGEGLAGSLRIGDVPGGSWALELRLVGDGTNICGLADSILVVSGCETSATVVFEPPNARLALAMIGPSFVAEALVALPPVRRIAPGAVARFSVPANAGPGAWFIEGIAAADGNDCAIIGPVEGRNRLDWVSAGSYSARSSRADLIVGSETSLGSLAWKESLVRSDLVAAPASKGIDGTRDLAFSPDGSFFVAIGKDGSALGGFALTDRASPLAFCAATKAEIAELDAPTRLHFLPGEPALLVLAEGSGSILSLVLSQAESPSLRGKISSPDLLSGRGLEVSPDGRFAYLASEGADSILLVPLDASGAPGTAIVAAKGGMPGLEAFDRPLCIALNPDGSLLAAGTAGDDAIYLFAREISTGSLSLLERLPKESFLPLASLSDPVDLLFSPDSASLYILSYYGKCLIRLDRNGTGNFVPASTLKSGSSGVSGFDYPKRLALSPDGRLLLVTGSGTTDGLSLVSAAVPGSLTYEGCLVPDGSDGRLSKPCPAAFSPDGLLVIAASPDDDRLALYSIAP
jgi:DNA-binding beta-propeller fold protein YncE